MNTPRHLVLDTNLLLRLLILDYSTPLEFFDWLGQLDIDLWTIPLQQDEVRRNLRGVYETHAGEWQRDTSAAKEALSNAAQKLKQLSVLGVDCEGAREAVNIAKRQTEELSLDVKPWKGLYVLATKVFGVARHPAQTEIDGMMTRAARRIDYWNPPCGEKKGKDHPAKRPLGDCAIWELVVHLVNTTDEEVWFATADSDFRHGATADLHPYLLHELEEAGSSQFRFLAEAGGTFAGKKPFGVVAAIEAGLPAPVAVGVSEATDVAADLVADPAAVASWVEGQATSLCGLQQRMEEQLRPVREMQRQVEEQLRPIREIQRQAEERLRPFREMQQQVHRQIEEHVRPFQEMQRQAEERLRPLKEMQQQVQNLMEERLRPFRELHRQAEERLRPLREMQRQAQQLVEDQLRPLREAQWLIQEKLSLPLDPNASAEPSADQEESEDDAPDGELGSSPET